MFTCTPPCKAYLLSLHDALPIWPCHFDRSAAKWRNLGRERWCCHPDRNGRSNTSAQSIRMRPFIDRKSTRLNSSHVKISYAVFCLKKKKIDSETLQYHCVETISD